MNMSPMGMKKKCKFWEKSPDFLERTDKLYQRRRLDMPF